LIGHGSSVGDGLALQGTESRSQFLYEES